MENCSFHSAVFDVPETLGETRTIDEYVQLGLCQNPAIAEAQNRIESIRHRIPQELSLPDPVVNTVTQLAPIQTAAGEQTFGLGVSQKFTSATRRATRAAIVSEEVRAAEAELQRVKLEIAEQIRVTCFQLLFVRRAIEISTEDFETLQQIAEVVQRQYEVQQAVTQQDVLNAQIEQSKLESRLSVLRRQEKSYSSRLARLVHLPSGSELAILDLLDVSTASLELEALTAQALQYRPELTAQLATIRRDRRKVCLANLQNRPDFTVGLNWIATSASGVSPVATGDDAVLLGVGFNLPIYKNRIRAAACEAKASARSSVCRYESLKDQIADEVFDLIVNAESTLETLALLTEDMIPKAGRTLNMSIDAYANGDGEYVQLMENWRSLLRMRLNEARLISEYNQTLASLTRSVGNLHSSFGEPPVSR